MASVGGEAAERARAWEALHARRTRMFQLRYDVSRALLRHAAEREGMSLADYCQVYDSEDHERLVRSVMDCFEQ